MQKLIEEYNYLDLKNINGFKAYKFKPKKQGGAVVNSVLKKLTGLNLKTANIEVLTKKAIKKGVFVALLYNYHSAGYAFIENTIELDENFNNIDYLIVKKVPEDKSILQIKTVDKAIKILDKLYNYKYKTLYRLKLGKWLDSHTFSVQKEVISLTKEEAENWGD
ncbi:hypothetical protein PUW59_05235 [Lactobacillus mulieris]|nr:hypothetical protein PUW59_05235 [Lactobacillus mulieris]